MHKFLSEQPISYAIYLVEPVGELKFNRGLLMNAGFVEALKDDDYGCFILHDVDMLPESPLNLYSCNQNVPKQMAIAISAYNYQ
jgi:hypothetical protein